MSVPDSCTEAALDPAFILGIGVSAITLDRAASTIEQWIERRTQKYVCVTGADGIIESRHDPQRRRIHNKAGMVTPDGMPLVFMARRLGFKSVSRVYRPDLMRLPRFLHRRVIASFITVGGPELPNNSQQH